VSELPRIGDWSGFEELRLLQDKQLGTVFERVAKSPFYQERFGGKPPAGLDQVRDFPLTSKADLRDSYPFGMLAVPRSRISTYHESSGSTGVPTPSYYTADEWSDLADRFARKAVAMTEDDTLLVRIPYALVIAGHIAHQAGLATGATVVPGDCRSLAAPYSRIVRVLHDLGVTLSWSTPNETLVWAAGARLAGYDTRTDFPQLRAFYVGGEPLSASRRSRITELWNAPVVEEYGCTEVGSMAGTCPEGRMHFWADRVLPEVLDVRTSTLSREGVGQLVLTPLFREAMPLLRYNLEDRVELRYEDCPCGWFLPTIRVLGRNAHGFAVRGKPVSQLRLEEAVFRLPADYGVLFWRARIAGERLDVQIEVDSAHRDRACAELAPIVEELLDVTADVSGVDPGTLVPAELLETKLDAMKPRKLFGAGEDWDSAILRC
jgi:phenylacetate-CoA ligase